MNLKNFLAACDANNNPAVSLKKDPQTADGIIVNLFDKNTTGFEIYFKADQASQIVVGNLGFSGHATYNAPDKVLIALAKAAKSKPDVSSPGSFIVAIGNALGVRGLTTHDSRPGYGTSTHSGAIKAIAAIQQELRNQAGHKDIIPRPVVGGGSIKKGLAAGIST